MADVVVVEPRHPAALVLGAEPLFVPVDDHDLTVGVDRGHDQQHHVVHPRQPLGVLGGGELVDELGAHLGRADLGRVDAAAHQRHRRGRPDELARGLGRQPAGFGDLPRVFADLIEARLVGGRGQNHHRHPVAQGRGPGLLDGHAVRCRRHQLEVGEDIGVGDQRAIGAHDVTEVFLGTRNGLGVNRKAISRQNTNTSFRIDPPILDTAARRPDDDTPDRTRTATGPGRQSGAGAPARISGGSQQRGQQPIGA